MGRFPGLVWVGALPFLLAAGACGSDRSVAGDGHAGRPQRARAQADRTNATDRGRGRDDDPAQEDLPPPDARGCLPGVPTLAPGVHRGMSFAHSWEAGGRFGYGTDAARLSLRELRALGVDWVSLTPFGYQRSLEDDRVRLPRLRGAETDARMVAGIRDARSQGFQVFYKPHVWVGGGDWVGRIDPGDEAAWDRWWASYRAFLLHHARIAQAEGVPLFAVGCELKTTSVRFADRWRGLVREVRQIYRGELVYAANWDEVVDVPWWDAVDHVGIQFYPPVAFSRAESESQKRARLQDYMGHLDALHRRTGKPVLFTEVGYRSRMHPEIRPHAWPEHDPDDAPPPSEAAQALAYRRLFQALEGRDWLSGLYVWKWFSNPESREEGADGFSPRGKRAAQVLATAFRDRCQD